MTVLIMSTACTADVVPIVMASGTLQKCLGITSGGAPMTHGPATQVFCAQLPGNEFYVQAGARYQAGDKSGAAQLVRRAAEAGNAVAQLRLALMYDQGDGVPQSAKTALQWYQRAAALGEPESQNQVASFYELGEGVEENWDLSARLRQASASQGWMKGEFSFARAFQFGIGVPQSRPQAIAWYQKSSAQGNAQATYWAKWLSDATNNIGFRDSIEQSIVLAGKLRFGATLMGGDPTGVTFHNSAQRALWLNGQRKAVDRDEAEVFGQIRKLEYDSCRSAGRDNCGFGRF
jgi:TPR repeat protein